MGFYVETSPEKILPTPLKIQTQVNFFVKSISVIGSKLNVKQPSINAGQKAKTCEIPHPFSAMNAFGYNSLRNRTRLH